MSFLQFLRDGQSSNDSYQQTNNEQLLKLFSTERGEEVEMPVMHEIIQRVMKPALEDLIHRVVRDGTDLATEWLWTSLNRKLENEILTSQHRSLKLKFVNKIPVEIFTRDKIIREDSGPIGIALVDGITDEVVKFGHLASAEVEIVVLEGDFGGNSRDDWTVEEFDSKIVKEMPGRKSILTGNKVNLTEGTALLRELHFTHNANWVKKCSFRLGAKVQSNGIRVKEAKTEPFTLKDFRTKYQQKPDLLSLNDEVSKLKGIGKKGPFRKRLIEANIKTVQDFLVQLYINPERLQQMHNGCNKMWTKIVSHAQECEIDKTVHMYPSPSSGQNTLQNQYVLINEVSQTQKADANVLTRGSSHLYNENDALNSTRLEASAGNHLSNSNIVDHDVANSFSRASSYNMEEFWSCVEKMEKTEKTEKSPSKWKIVYVALKFVNNKRTVAIRVEETHIQKKRKF